MDATLVKVPLRRIQRVGEADLTVFDDGLAYASGAAFERGDLVATLGANGWEKADGDHDVATMTRLAVALNNPSVDAFSVPLTKPAPASGTFGTRYGPEINRFMYAKLGPNTRWIINVNNGTAYTEALRGNYYGLLYDSTGDGYMTVDLSDTTNDSFFVEGLAPAEYGGWAYHATSGEVISPGVQNVLGNKQVRVIGYFHPDRIY